VGVYMCGFCFVLVLVICVLVFTVFCIIYCNFCIVSFMYMFSYLFCLCCHRVTTQLQLVTIVIIIIIWKADDKSTLNVLCNTSPPTSPPAPYIYKQSLAYLHYLRKLEERHKPNI
jgi:hypothetical protein